VVSADETEVKPIKITGARGPTIMYMFLFFSAVICRMFKLTHSDQAQSFRFHVKIFFRSFFVQGLKQIFDRDPNPLPAFVAVVS
jgi:hypothetical protein